MVRLPFVYDTITWPEDAAESDKKTAREKMSQLTQRLADMPPYQCPSDCSDCCQGSILLSYHEYLHILAHLKTKPGAPGLIRKKLGTLRDGKLLCPFLCQNNHKEHCSIYEARPLICRVHGTQAAPCHRDIPDVAFTEEQFNKAHQGMYLDEAGEFTGLFLQDHLVLYQGPFDIWFLADRGKGEAAALLDFFLQEGTSLGAVLFDIINGYLFTLHGGQKVILEG